MENNICERCGIDFEEKKRLVQHLKRKRWCIAIENDIDPNILLDALTHKEGITCVKCNKIYASKDSLRRHKCSSITPENTINELKNTIKVMKEKFSKNATQNKLDEIQQKLIKLQDVVSNMGQNTQISNTLIDNSITNNITVNINSLKSPSEQQIQYIINSEDFKQKLLKWITSKNGIFEYIDTKFYNPEHPENQMIKSSDNKQSIELHIYGMWKKYDNMKGSDLILTNVGNDFDIYIEVLKERNEYNKHKKKILLFKDKIVDPLEWGTDISGDENSDDSSVLFDKKEKIQNMLIKHIHQK
jgi:hypothetical protein